MTLFEVRLTFFEVSVGLSLSTKAIWLYLPLSEFGFQWRHSSYEVPYYYMMSWRYKLIGSIRGFIVYKSDGGSPPVWSAWHYYGSGGPAAKPRTVPRSMCSQ